MSGEASSARKKMPERLIRVCIIEDHAVVRSGLRMLIEARPGMVVVGEAGNRRETFEIASLNPPDVFILDVDLRTENGLDFLPELISTFKQARVLVLTSATDPSIHQRAIAGGAMGLVLKEQASDTLISAIEKVYLGEAWLTRSMMASVLGKISRESEDSAELRKIQALTKREREIIALLAQGLKRQQIAQKLYISDSTVRNHLTAILSKLELADRFELVFYAYKHGLAKPPGENN